jgi:hypothetical protein
MILRKDRVAWLGWSLLIILGLVGLRIKMSIPGEPLITIRDIIVWILGIASAVAIYFIGHFIQNSLNKYPQKLFKAFFSDKLPYRSQEFGKPLILPVGKTCKQFMLVSTIKTVNDINRIGIRPQVGLKWYKCCFLAYNQKTDNISFSERNNPPVRIKSIKDVCDFRKENFDREEDDGACGRFGYYNSGSLLNMIPSQLVMYEIEIETSRQWRGSIDFRIDTKDGMRVIHHPCEIK